MVSGYLEVHGPKIVHILSEGKSWCVERQDKLPNEWPEDEVWVAPGEVPWDDDRLCLGCVQRYTVNALRFDVFDHLVTLRSDWLRRNTTPYPEEPVRIYLTDRTMKQVEASLAAAGFPVLKMLGGRLLGMNVCKSSRENEDYIE